MNTIEPRPAGRHLDIAVASRPTVKDLYPLLIEGKLEEFALLKAERISEWRTQRYRVCLECGKRKLRVMFTGDAKYCKQCVSGKKKESATLRREYHKTYQRTERGQMLFCAKQVVYNLKKMGLLIQSPCEVCGEAKSQAHHDDYSKPWMVRWLCKLHHTDWHLNNHPKETWKLVEKQ